MSKLRGIARFTFHEGRVDEFKALSEKCVEIVREREPGTLQYAIYFNSEQTEAVVYEEYENAQALLDHLQNVGELMAPIADTATILGELLGHAGDDLRAMMANNDQPRLFEPFLSMHGA